MGTTLSGFPQNSRISELCLNSACPCTVETEQINRLISVTKIRKIKFTIEYLILDTVKDNILCLLTPKNDT